MIDAQRVSVGLKKLVEDTPDQFSTFVHRQPEHVEIAGSLGLGEWDRAMIDLREVKQVAQNFKCRDSDAPPAPALPF